MKSLGRVRVAIPSMTEAVVLDCQKVLKTGSFAEQPFLKKRISTHLEAFSARQIVILLNLVDDKRLVHQLLSRLDPARMTLRDFAMVVHVLGKRGIRNEIFLVSNETAIRRKIAHSLDVSSLVLLLGGYTKLGLLGDGKLVDSLLARIGDSLKSTEDSLKSTEAVTEGVTEAVTEAVSVASLKSTFPLLKSTEAVSVCVSLGRLKRTAIFLPQLIQKIDPQHAGSALLALSKVVSADDNKACLDPLYTGFLSSVPTLSLFHQVQGFQALGLLKKKDDLVCVFDRILDRLKQKEPCSVSTTVLLLAAMNRAAETLRVGRILAALNCLETDALCPQGTAVYLNLLSTINFNSPLVLDGLLSAKTIALSGQTVAVCVNALAKLDCNEEIYTLLAKMGDPDSVVATMSDQGLDMCILGLANLIDLRPRALLSVWLESLVSARNKRRFDSSNPESVTQLRIAAFLLAPLSIELKVPRDFPVSKSTQVVSQLHSQVVDTLTNVIRDSPMYTNKTDPATGYEIDIYFAE